ncbi:MAG TPA: DNA polymerase III subunit alpha, partial [Rhodospirillaceae bacterium]|nr:DNA polymerase III subunit alpha [Rhodospirillaceae bacterium]
VEEIIYTSFFFFFCFGENFFISMGNRRRLTPHHRFKTAQEMSDLFSDIPEAVKNTLVVAQRCAFKVDERAPILPKSPKTGDRTEDEALFEMAGAGLDKRLEDLVYREGMTREEKAAAAKPYRERLGYELEMIGKTGFPGYFMIVADFIQWAKSQGIPVGPGRGSGAGSLVAW